MVYSRNIVYIWKITEKIKNAKYDFDPRSVQRRFRGPQRQTTNNYIKNRFFETSCFRICGPESIFLSFLSLFELNFFNRFSTLHWPWRAPRTPMETFIPGMKRDPCNDDWSNRIYGSWYAPKSERSPLIARTRSPLAEFLKGQIGQAGHFFRVKKINMFFRKHCWNTGRFAPSADLLRAT